MSISIFTHLIHLVLLYLQYLAALCGLTYLSNQGTDAGDLFSFAVQSFVIPSISPLACILDVFFYLFFISCKCFASRSQSVMFACPLHHSCPVLFSIASVTSVFCIRSFTLSLWFSSTFLFLFNFFALFQFFLIFSSSLLSSQAKNKRILFCSRKSSQPDLAVWLCTTLIGSREIIPVEHDVLDGNSQESNKITHTSSPISKLQTLYPVTLSLIRRPSRSLSGYINIFPHYGLW